MTLFGGATILTRRRRERAWGRTPNGRYYYLTDSIGSVVALTDEQGQLAGRYRYAPYGQTAESSVTVDNPIRFAGQYLDGATGLYKMGVRYYDPAVGRWTQKDPLNLFQDPTQGNRYAYAGADPVNRVDPSGRINCGDVSDISMAISEGSLLIAPWLFMAPVPGARPASGAALTLAGGGQVWSWFFGDLSEAGTC